MTADQISQSAGAKTGEDLDWQEDRSRLAATEIFVLAIQGGYIPPAVWTLIGRNLKLEAIATSALAEARLARWVADETSSKMSSLRALVRSLEERLNNLTPGIGEPK